MARRDVALIHWHPEESRHLAAQLRAAGWRVAEWPVDLKDLKAEPPVAVVVSLRRLPSHGREVADALWFTKWGRAIPIVFVDGEPDKVAATRTKFPKARYASWARLPALLRRLADRKEEA